MTDVNLDEIVSMEDLRRLKVSLGQSPQEVGYVEDFQQRRGSGENLLSCGPDGRWIVAAYERDKVLSPQVFDTERLAIRWLAERAVRRARQPVVQRSDEERASADARRAEMIARSRRARDTS